MKKKTIGILVLVITALTTFFTPAAQANVLQVSVDNIYLTAGEANTLKISLKNIGDLDIYTVEALLSSQTPGISVIKEAQKIYDEVLQGKSKVYYPVLFVDMNTPLGTYTLTLSVKYIRYGTVIDSTVTVPVGVIISNESRPKILYVSGQETVNAKTGTSTALLYVFRNDWDQNVRNVRLTINSGTSYIAVTDGMVSSFDAIMPGEEVRVAPTVSVLMSVPLGAYTLTATATYEDASGNAFYQNFALPVNLDSKVIAKNTIVTISNMEVAQTVRPGDSFDVFADVQCEGADAFDLISYISLTGITKVSLGDLAKGDTERVTWRLLASGDIPAGQYPVSIVVTYIDDKGTPGSLTEVMTITVEELIDFELLDTPSVEAKKGETKELEADLLLIGTDSVQFVSVDLVESPVFRRVSGSTEYIGAVDPDSPIPFNIKYKVADDAPLGSHTMSVRVNYRDHLNREHHEDVGLDVTVVGAQSGGTETPQTSSLWMWVRRFLGLGP
jgi:hypothetical protein